MNYIESFLSIVIVEISLANINYFELNVKTFVARAELGEFVEYDLDNEDEDWIQEFNEEKELLTPEM